MRKSLLFAVLGVCLASSGSAVGPRLPLDEMADRLNGTMPGISFEVPYVNLMRVVVNVSAIDYQQMTAFGSKMLSGNSIKEHLCETSYVFMRSLSDGANAGEIWVSSPGRPPVKLHTFVKC